MIYLIFGCSSGANRVETIETMDIMCNIPPVGWTQWTKKNPVDTMDVSPFD
jgi:hypothetical protein